MHPRGDVQKVDGYDNAHISIRKKIPDVKVPVAIPGDQQSILTCIKLVKEQTGQDRLAGFALRLTPASSDW